MGQERVRKGSRELLGWSTSMALLPVDSKGQKVEARVDWGLKGFEWLLCSVGLSRVLRGEGLRAVRRARFAVAGGWAKVGRLSAGRSCWAGELCRRNTASRS